MIKFHFKLLILSSLGCLCLITHHAHSQGNFNQMMTPRQPAMQEQGLSRRLEALWLEHGRLLNEAIVAALNNAPQNVIEAGKDRLMRNCHDIANLIASLYGPQAGATFENLFTQHIQGGIKYTNAIKMKNLNLANQVANEATENGRALAKFFTSLGSSVPYATWQQLFDHHVMIEAAQTRAYFQGNINQANQLRDESLVQLREMAKIMASAFLNRSSVQMNTPMNAGSAY